MVGFPTPHVEFASLSRRIQPPEGLVIEDWAVHPNGGGWVQKSAFVSRTAFVGPHAIVSGEARVLDQARILDEASVTDWAIIAGSAVVGGRASVAERARLFGTVVVVGDAKVGGHYYASSGEIREDVSKRSTIRRRSSRPRQLSLELLGEGQTAVLQPTA